MTNLVRLDVLDAILLGMVLEALALTALYRLRGQGVAPGALLPNLLSGMGLLLAMRLALGGAFWGWIAASLLGALLCHIAELRRNWQKTIRRP